MQNGRLILPLCAVRIELLEWVGVVFLLLLCATFDPYVTRGQIAPYYHSYRVHRTIPLLAYWVGVARFHIPLFSNRLVFVEWLRVG